MTAQLAQLYKSAGKDRPYEIVLIGYDKDRKAHEEYMAKNKMPWLGLKMSAKSDIVGKLVPSSAFLPGLVLMDESGKVLLKENGEVLKKLESLSKSKP